MPSRSDDFEAFGAAHPVRDFDRFEPHVLEAVPAHLFGRPLDGGVEVLRTAEPVPEGVSELRQALPGEAGGPRFLDQAARRFVVRVEPPALCRWSAGRNIRLRARCIQARYGAMSRRSPVGAKA